MYLSPQEYKQKIQKFSKSTLLAMANTLFDAKNLQEVQNYHKIVMEAKTEQEVVQKLQALMTDSL